MNKTWIAALVLTGAMTGGASAASSGLTCDGVAQIVVAPTAAAAGACVAERFPTCGIGFRVNGGYFAVAATEDGLAQGAAGGFRSQTAAEARAMETCAAVGAGVCAITNSALDDGETTLNCD